MSRFKFRKFFSYGLWLYLAAFALLYYCVDYRKVAVATLNIIRADRGAEPLIRMAKGSVPITFQELQTSRHYYNSFVIVNPELAEGYSALGFCNFHLGNYSKALKAYRKAAELNPQLAGIYYNLGVVYYKRKDYKSAADMLVRSIGLNPRELVVRQTLFLGTDNAVDILKGVYLESYSLLYDIYLKTGQKEKAESIRLKGLSIVPEAFQKERPTQEWALFYHVPVKVFNNNGHVLYKM